MIAEPIKHAATCTRCGKHLVLEQDAECPALIIQKWLPIIVCNRCGKYLEAYRRIDDAIAYVCNQWMLVKDSKSANEARSHLREKLEQLTKKMASIISERWVTTNEWSMDWVDLLIEKPNTSRMASRSFEKMHQKARESADRKLI